MEEEGKKKKGMGGEGGKKSPGRTDSALCNRGLKSRPLGIFHNMKRQTEFGPLAWWDQCCQCHLFSIPRDFCIPTTLLHKNEP